MSDRLKEIIGDELYGKVSEALKAKNIKSSEVDLITNNFIPKTRFDEINLELKSNKEKVTSYEKQINETKKLLDGHEELKTNYETLNQKYKTDLELKDKEIGNITKISKVKESLVKEGAKHVDLLMKSINLDDITIEGDNVKGFTDVVKSLRTSYSDMFVSKMDDSKPPKGSSSTGSTDSTGSNVKDDDYGVFGQFLNAGKL